jgi:(2R)-3-sulfolactate dehydrogenase (NADP+)
MKKKPQDLFRLAKQALMNAGAHETMAVTAAQHLVQAEEQGLSTHGMSRVPFYCSMLRSGRADGRAKPSMTAERAAVCLIDNADGLPYESAAWAIEEVMQRARRNGIGFAGIRNSAHVGVLGIHLQRVAQAGMVGIAFTNSPAAIPAWGGKKALFGTNPVAFAFPRHGTESLTTRHVTEPPSVRKDIDPIVVDLALTTVTRGKIMVAMQKGERIPVGWALDRHGKPTTDPKEAIEQGSLFPIGGAKGAMLALAFELVCAALTGAAIGPEADSFFSEQGNKPRIGQAFLAIDPGALAGTDKYFERVETVVRTMLADEGVRLPGAKRFASEKKLRAEGIEVADELLAKIEKLAA